jgi:preprotein translocase subunit YajC
MGNVILAAASKSSSSSSLFFLAIIVLFGLLYFVTIRPQRNRQRRIQETQREVAPGARVRTTAGMYATVASVDGDDVVLEVSPGVEVRFMRRAIMDVVPDGDEDAAAASGEADGSEASPDGAVTTKAQSGDGAEAEGDSGEDASAATSEKAAGPSENGHSAS